jgi:transcriptional regulator with XRE-family HTH domain
MPGPGNVGERVRNLRLTRRLSQAQLAGHDLSDSYISLIESGKRTPTPTVLRMLAERLGCTPEYLADGIEPEQRAHLEVRERHAELARLDGDPETALTILDEVLARSDDADLTARARWTRAQSLADLGRTEAAIAVFEEIREQAERDTGQGCWLPPVIALARCYHLVGDLGQSIALGERAIGRLHELGLSIGPEHAELGRVLMLAYVDRSDLDRARDLGRTLLATAPDVIDGPAMAVAYRKASARALETGAIGDALFFARRAIEAYKESEAAQAQALLNVAGARALLRGMGAVRLAGAEPGAGYRHGREIEPAAAQEALELLHAAAPRLTGADAADCRVETARALVHIGKIDQAVELAEQTLAEPGGDPLGAARARLILARARLAGGEPQSAGPLLESVADELRKLPSGRAIAQVLRELGDLFEAVGDAHGATDAYRRALEAAGLRAATRPQASPARV